jgi:hypothetical protein
MASVAVAWITLQAQRTCQARNQCEADGKRSYCLDYSSGPKMEATGISETSVDFQQTYFSKYLSYPPKSANEWTVFVWSE